MKRGHHHSGFTIVEVLIFLAVTSAIMIVAIPMVSRSQRNNTFYQAINDLNTQVSGVASKVTNGEYAVDRGTDECDAGTNPGDKPVFRQGTSGSTCVYIGKMLQFTEGPEFYVHTIIGRRLAGPTPKEVTTMTDASPQILQPTTSGTNSNYPNATDVRKMPGGLRVAYAYYRNAADVVQNVAGFGFLGSLGISTGAGADLQSGAQTTDLAPAVFNNPLILSDAQNNQETFTERFNSSFATKFDGVANPESGLVLCINSGTTEQHGVITVGGQNNRTTTKLVISNGYCSAPN